MKSVKRVLSLLLVLTMVITLLPSTYAEAASKKKKTKLNVTKVELNINNKKTVELKNYAKLSKKKVKKVKWSLSNKKVATLKVSGKYKQKCTVTAKEAGSTTLKLKYNGKTYKCAITVTSKVVSEQEKTTENKQVVTTEKEKATEHKHEFTDWYVTKPVSCTEYGCEERTCKTCGNKETRSLAVKGHTWTEWQIIKDATCDEEGSRYRVCTSCGTKDDLAIKPTGHTWGKWETVEPTCTKDGTKTRKCVTCDEEEVENLSAIGHDWSDWEVAESTCTEKGTKKRKCNNCGGEEVEYLPIAEHTWEVVSVSGPPVCVADGTKKSKCSVCGEEKTETVPKVDHTWGDWEVTLEPTCKDVGKETRECSVCGMFNTKEIPATGTHTEVNGGLSTCHTKCSVCGVTVKNGNYHQFVDTVETESTCKKQGTLKHTCSCGYTYTESLPLSDKHNFSSVDYQCLECGAFDEESAVEVCDVSDAQDGGIMLYAYRVKEGSDYYDVYLKSYKSDSFLRYHATNDINGGKFLGSDILKEDIRYITFVNTVRANNSCRYLFEGIGTTYNSVTGRYSYIDGLNKLDTSNTFDMTGMFYNAYLPEYMKVDLNTRSATSMQSMFAGCKSVSRISFGSSFNTSNVITMNNMFAGMTGCTYFDFGNGFNTENVTDMSWMFSKVGQKVTDTELDFVLDLSCFNTSRVTSMTGMFNEMYGPEDYTAPVIKSFKLILGSNFTTKSVKTVAWMFYCTGYKAIYNDRTRNSYIDLGEFGVEHSNITDIGKIRTGGTSTEKYALFKTSNSEVINWFVNEGVVPTDTSFVK